MPAIALPPPAPGSETPVREALRRRRTVRQIASAPLPATQLSALLWAAFGVNRAAGPFGHLGRTAASASNSQEIDVYVALAEGAYLYDGPQHQLVQITDHDLRQKALTPGQQVAFGEAPVVLIYAVDVRRLTHTSGFPEPRLQDPEWQKAYYYVDTGLIAGNVHLFAAAEGLAAWFHNCDRDALHRDLDLAADQHVLFAQSVGYPQHPEAVA
jgi:nitroreductase